MNTCSAERCRFVSRSRRPALLVRRLPGVHLNTPRRVFGWQEFKLDKSPLKRDSFLSRYSLENPSRSLIVTPTVLSFQSQPALLPSDSFTVIMSLSPSMSQQPRAWPAYGALPRRSFSPTAHSLSVTFNAAQSTQAVSSTDQKIMLPFNLRVTTMFFCNFLSYV